MSNDNFAVASSQLTTPGQANPSQAKAVEMQAEKAAQAPGLEGKESGTDWNARKAEAKVEANQGLLNSMFGKAARTSTSNAQKINYQEVATQIEDVLRKELGDENFSLDKLAESTAAVEGEEDYWSPERTAERIAVGATSYFETFKKQHPNLSEEELMDRYMAVIAPAIDRGFEEAKDILKGFKVYDGEIEANAERTQELVHEKLARFRTEVLNPPSQEKPLIDDAQGLTNQG
ncbi:DUF5610 domain-containing protein [Marinospirillum perlucidum]|uniref:DUF5610 domain-containing protein n=1 Tax=Marinospirillum perlucidum TaxID=1982602 RepID=UPI00138FC75D|nr:DUF5610 domain-containing protein [Marinospirillum perlucidum]